MKSAHVWSFSGPYFPVFSQNTEIYRVHPSIQSECGEIRTRKTSNTHTFHAVIEKSRDTSIYCYWNFVFLLLWIWGKFGWKIWLCKSIYLVKAMRHFPCDGTRIVNCRKITANSNWITVPMIPMIQRLHDYESLFCFVLFLIFFVFCFLFWFLNSDNLWLIL